MIDVVTPDVRRRMMASIRGSDTKPELFVRHGLHRMGFRFRLGGRSLPGRPDLVFPKYKAVLFVHGCFWHRHCCHLFKWPASRPDFWREKLDGNARRDDRTSKELLQSGWRVGVVWECALKGRKKLPPNDVLFACHDWLLSPGMSTLEVYGQ